ncbi:class E sortase [Streptomyces sp. BPTC-684]|uniref:class E sortase n=1 Tax=Streptomyces sp. BPTC-684 TaxID=3043734 RepID=UPI0024B0571F|nr:class E sortase [Streptomyces sp. BPTC-684]WHM41379.1 class E sortase [Streptomyces sp. BPTC-684]
MRGVRKPPSREPVRLRPLGRTLWAGAEAVVTLGLVLLLLVAHQLWWTNREARHEARQTVRSLEREWGGQVEGRSPEAAPVGAVGPATPAAPHPAAPAAPARETPADPDRAYAVLRLPSLGVTAPVAEGISKRGVLDKGYAGHYAGTAQPGQAGNFALAGHRNTHGEPFRYINRLRPGDKLVVETRDAVFTYRVDRTLPQTSARDSAVIAPVPRSDVRTKYGYGERGYYITLTTCTPEFTSRYRLVVWGKLASMRPR